MARFLLFLLHEYGRLHTSRFASRTFLARAGSGLHHCRNDLHSGFNGPCVVPFPNEVAPIGTYEASSKREGR